MNIKIDVYNKKVLMNNSGKICGYIENITTAENKKKLV